MHRFIPLLALASTAIAGSPVNTTKTTPEPPRVLTFAEVEASYSGDAAYEEGGEGSTWESRVRAGWIIPLPQAPLPGRQFGEWQLRLGMDYQRFEFDHNSPLPLPDQLQGLSAILALELNIGGQIGALLDVRPGFYFEDDINDSAFDVTVRLGAGWRLTDDFSLVFMARYSGMAQFPMLAAVGFVWNLTPNLNLAIIYPEPRLTWKASDQWSIWLGGDFAGRAYRTSDRSELGRAVVDYTDSRAVLGATYETGIWRIEAALGASIHREWDYHRAEQRFHTDEPSPFAKLSVNARW